MKKHIGKTEMNEENRLMKKQYDYLLVGSGLFAGVFAYHAKKAGKTCLVLEKREHAGGNI